MVVLSAAAPSSGDPDVIELKLMMMLEAFNVLVCDQCCSTADIKVQGKKEFPVLAAAYPPLAVSLTDPRHVCPFRS